MITAAYTICKNELQFVEKWLYYTKDFTYRVLLDTGSTDGTWELLMKRAETDKNLIIEQKIFDPWIFSVARNYNLDMVPNEVEWCLSPDLDEYFSINVLDEMQRTMQLYPDVTNISCDRLDVYSKHVRVGPPDSLPTNKIHRRHDYTWVQPIYEHLWFKHTDRQEAEKYNEKIYLIHDQDFKKQSRPELYVKMLREEYEKNPSNCWTLWFLLGHYFNIQDLDNYIDCAISFLKYNTVRDEKFMQVTEILKNIYLTQTLTPEQKTNILTCLSNL